MRSGEFQNCHTWWWRWSADACLAKNNTSALTSTSSIRVLSMIGARTVSNQLLQTQSNRMLCWTAAGAWSLGSQPWRCCFHRCGALILLQSFLTVTRLKHCGHVSFFIGISISMQRCTIALSDVSRTQTWKYQYYIPMVLCQYFQVIQCNTWMYKHRPTGQWNISTRKLCYSKDDRAMRAI